MNRRGLLKTVFGAIAAWIVPKAKVQNCLPTAASCLFRNEWGPEWGRVSGDWSIRKDRLFSIDQARKVLGKGNA